MSTPADIVETYIRAKDGNRPHLMAAAFAEAAKLEVIVKAGAISFPPTTTGLQAITDVLVRTFVQTYENVYTFCLSTPPATGQSFRCRWLVGMSERVSGVVRVGCGSYEWDFLDVDPWLARRLVITIEQMEVAPTTDLAAVMGWLGRLPYPWCPLERATSSAPNLESLAPLLALLSRS
jgi:hypothetical protein